MALTEGRARIDRRPGRVIVPVRPPYNFRRTLQCGQVFRWRVYPNGASGVFAGRVVRIWETSDGIAVDGLRDERDPSRFRRYLGVDEPLAAIEAQLAQDPVLHAILPHTSGIAIMRQDPWECLLSFVTSAFNNIPKIDLSLNRLAQRFGDRIGEDAWGCPDAHRIAAARLRELRGCALGYRAPYVQAVARQVASGEVDLDGLGRLAYQEARDLLLTLPGVGEKVADCVLLFGFGKTEAFPVDVWITRAVERWYFGGRSQSPRQIRAFARLRFGSLAGYAQQHLFSYARDLWKQRRARTQTVAGP